MFSNPKKIINFILVIKKFKVNNIFFKGVLRAGLLPRPRPKELAPLETSLFCSPPQSGGAYKIIKNR